MSGQQPYAGPPRGPSPPMPPARAPMPAWQLGTALAGSVGGAGLIAGFVLHAIKVGFGTAHVSVGVAHGLCTTPLGLYGQAASAQASSACGRVGLLYGLGTAAFVVAGLGVLAAIGLGAVGLAGSERAQ